MSYLAYEIMKEKVSVGRDGPTATIELLCPWNEVESFALAMVGGFRGFGGALSYFAPAVYESAGLFAYCNKCDYEGVRADTDGSGWDVAKVVLSFGPLDQPEDEEQNQNPTQIADYSYDITAQELTLPKTALQVWSPGENEFVDMGEDDQRPIKIVAEGSLQANFSFKPALDASKWVPYVGKVNEAEFRGHPAESVLFIGPQVKRTRTTDGKDAWSYSVAFEVKYEHTWNQVWKAELAQWVDVNPAQYETADFDELVNNL